jgi:predicted GNAT superfamily acetyltransferase
MLIRPLETLEECRTVAALERIVWGYTDAEDIVPPPVLIVSIKRGGVLLGAFNEAGEMKGFVYSIAGFKGPRPIQWSHMLGVVPDARDSGIGARLKLAQREQTLEMGMDLIEWTYDPLQALNAHFNFAKLGVVVEEYAENLYGQSSSPLHGGTPTDRFIAQWRIAEPHVTRRIAKLSGPPPPLSRSRTVSDAAVINPSKGDASRLEPGASDLDSDAPQVMVEIPMGFTEMLASDPARALEWRLRTRDIFQAYFARGYRAADFMLDKASNRGWYLLTRGESLVPNP